MSIHYAWDCGDWPDELPHTYEEFLHSDCKKTDLALFSDEDLETLDKMVCEAECRIYYDIDDHAHNSFEIISCDRPIVEQMIKCRKTGRGFAQLRKLVHSPENDWNQ